MFDPKELTLAALPSVALEARYDLPTCQGIYFATIPDGTVLYIGKAGNILSRWKGHHRRFDLSRWQDVSISWLSFDGDDEILTGIERACIEYFSPVLNKPEGRPKRLVDADTVARSFNFPKDLYEELQRISEKEQRDVTRQVTIVLSAFVSEYQRRERSEIEPGQYLPAWKAA